MLPGPVPGQTTPDTMQISPLPALLDEILNTVDRRYRLPPLSPALSTTGAASPATTLAVVMEAARHALAAGQAPDPALEHRFTTALAQMIGEAADPQTGDPAFQAIVLRQQDANVREYVSLSARASQDERTVRSAVNAVAHPAKVARRARAPQREALVRLHTAALAGSWVHFHDTLQSVLSVPEVAADSALVRDLAALATHSALADLQRLEALASDANVRRYQTLWGKQGPRSGSVEAAAQGSAARQRGAAVEATAAHALNALARRLNANCEPSRYRVVTSMRVPASLPGQHAHAKTEWDVALLERAPGEASATGWNLRFLLEAKASADAATMDLPRLKRGLSLLASAEEAAIYAFETNQGAVHLHGSSLRALSADDSALQREVLYCCDAPADSAPRPLSPASRMQLLSAPASLDYAGGLMQSAGADPKCLVTLWQAVLALPQWRGVLHQYAVQQQARELMVHCGDFLLAIENAARGSSAAELTGG